MATHVDLDHYISEEMFQAKVVKLAKFFGWQIFHDRMSKGKTAGWPDLVLMKVPYPLVFMELKKWDGTVKPTQAAVIRDLVACGQHAFIFRPADWPTIETILTKGPEWLSRRTT